MSKITEILITLPLSKKQLEKLSKLAENLNITHVPTSDPAEVSNEIWEKTEVLFTESIFPETDQIPNLRWVQAFSNKRDFRDQSSLMEEFDLKITTMEGIDAIQVAEHAVGLLLALSRKLPDLFNLQENNEWLSNPAKSYQPQEIFGSTVGIVGYNRAGRQIARLLKAFDCKILASKSNLLSPESNAYVPKGTGDPEGKLFTRLYPHQALRSMFKDCDFVIIAAPYSETTRKLVGEKQLEALSPNSLLVDVSGGGIVDLESLTDFLADNRIAGAAIDAYQSPPLPAENLLWSLPNVIISPNVSSISKKHFERALDLFSSNLLNYLDGRKLSNTLGSLKG